MNTIINTRGVRPAVILGGMLLLGMLEFVALQRSQRAGRQDREALTSA